VVKNRHTRRGAQFAAIPHEHRNNYWFVFFSERLDTMWVMSSAEFIAESVQNKAARTSVSVVSGSTAQRATRKRARERSMSKSATKNMFAATSRACWSRCSDG